MKLVIDRFTNSRQKIKSEISQELFNLILDLY